MGCMDHYLHKEQRDFRSDSCWIALDSIHGVWNGKGPASKAGFIMDESEARLDCLQRE